MKLVPSLLVVAGLLMAGGGGWLFLTDAAKRDAERVAALPRHTPAGLGNLAADTPLLLEGRLASSAAPGPQGFLVYHREQFLRREEDGPNRGKEEWLRIETRRPPIAVEGEGVAVAVGNLDYRLDGWKHRGQTDAVPRYVSVLYSTERYLGFKAGDEVTIDGRVVREPGNLRAPPQVRALVLFGGNAAAYAESVRGGILVFKIVGGIFFGLGVLLTTAGVLWLRAAPARR